MLHSLFILLITFYLMDFILDIFATKNFKKLFLLLKISLILLIISIESSDIYTIIYGKYYFVFDWNYAINDFKYNPIKYIYGLFVFIGLFSIWYLIYRIFNFYFGYICDKYYKTFDIKTKKVAFGKLINLMSHDGLINIENNKIVKDENTKEIKSLFLKLRYNILIGEQSLTASLILLFMFSNFFRYSYIICSIVLIVHLLLSYFINYVIRNTKGINKLL